MKPFFRCFITAKLFFQWFCSYFSSTFFVSTLTHSALDFRSIVFSVFIQELRNCQSVLKMIIVSLLLFQPVFIVIKNTSPAWFSCKPLVYFVIKIEIKIMLLSFCNSYRFERQIDSPWQSFLSCTQLTLPCIWLCFHKMPNDNFF